MMFVVNRASKLLVASGALVAFCCARAHAAENFAGLVERLQKIVACDVSTFPTNATDKSSLSSFLRKLKAAGATERHIGAAPEDKIEYRLPSSISIFGQSISKIDNFSPPFVMIEFNMPVSVLLSAVAKANRESLRMTSDGVYELANKKLVQAAGAKYPFERNIVVYGTGSKSV